MTLHLYLARRFLARFLTLLGAFFALAVLTDATTLGGRFEKADIGFAETLRLALLQAPSSVYQLMSMIVILASLLMFRHLSRTSELVSTRAAGLSALRTLLAPALTAFLIGVFGMMALNPLAATSLRRYESETGRYQTGAISAFSLSRKGLWLRQGSETGQTVIFAQRANFDATRLSGVTFFEFAENGIVTRRIETSFARLGGGAWNLGPGKYWPVSIDRGIPDKNAVAFDTLKLGSDLTSDEILDSFGDPTTIPFWDLPTFIQRMEKSGFSTEPHRVQFQIELASPLLLAAMVLVGAVFSLRHNRESGAGLRVLLTVIAGLFVYIFQDFAQILGSNGAIPVAAAAWGPPVSAFLLALGYLLQKEDG